MILSHKRPMVKLNRRELDHFRLEGDPGYYVLQRVNDETRSGTVLIARAMLQGREFEIVNHNGGGNPSYVGSAADPVTTGNNHASILRHANGG